MTEDAKKSIKRIEKKEVNEKSFENYVNECLMNDFLLLLLRKVHDNL